MARKEIAIDFGSKNIIIYEKGKGLVLNQPTLAVISNAPRGRKLNLVAVGSAAEQMIGRIEDGQKIVSPINEGVIVHEKAAYLMLNEFFTQLYSGPIFKKSFNVLACIPSGATNTEKKLYEDVIINAGASEVTFIESPICTAQLADSNCVLVVDIGGAKTEIAIVNEQGIVVGCTIDIAGEKFNAEIMKYISDTHKLILQRFSTEKLKTTIASLYDNDSSTAMITGRSVLDNTPHTIKIGAKEIKKAIVESVEDLCDVIEKISIMAPVSLAEELYSSGIILCGGSSKINGMSQYLERRLKISVKTVEENELGVINGAAKLLENKEKIGKYLNLSNFK